MTLPTLRELIERHLRPEEGDPEPKEWSATPATKEGFEAHKASLEEWRQKSFDRLHDASSAILYYDALLVSALRWKPGMPQGGPIWAVREAVVRDLQEEILRAQAAEASAQSDFDNARKALAKLTEESYAADAAALNQSQRDFNAKLHKRACEDVAAHRAHREAVLASFEESQK